MTLQCATVCHINCEYGKSIGKKERKENKLNDGDRVADRVTLQCATACHVNYEYEKSIGKNERN